MKKSFEYIIKLIGSIGLILLAYLLFLLITPFAFTWRLCVSISSKNRKFVEVFTALSKYFLEIAASFDQLGNAVFGGFLQWFFISKQATSFYEFGDKDETVSEVLGWNQQLNALSKTGIIIVNLLDWLDKDHCKRAMYVGIKKAHLKIHVSNGIL